MSIKTPTIAQNPPMAFPVIDEGVCVPYPTEKRKCMNLKKIWGSEST